MTTKGVPVCKSWIQLHSSLEIFQSRFMVFLQAIAISHGTPAIQSKLKCQYGKS